MASGKCRTVWSGRINVREGQRVAAMQTLAALLSKAARSGPDIRASLANVASRQSAAVRIWPASVGGRRYQGWSSGGSLLCHRNLTFGSGKARWRVSSSATRSGQRLLPLAANGRCRPIPADRRAPKLSDDRPGSFTFRIYEAAVRGHRQSATTCPSRRVFKSCRGVPTSDRFQATNLKHSLARPGQLLTFEN